MKPKTIPTFKPKPWISTKQSFNFSNIILTFQWSALLSFYGLCMQVAQPKKSNHVLLSLTQKCYRGGSTDACVGCTREFVEAHQKDSKSGFCFFSHGCVTASKDSLPVHLWCVWRPKRSQNLMLFLPKSCSPGSFQKSCGFTYWDAAMRVGPSPQKVLCVTLLLCGLCMFLGGKSQVVRLRMPFMLSMSPPIPCVVAKENPTLLSCCGSLLHLQNHQPVNTYPLYFNKILWFSNK